MDKKNQNLKNKDIFDLQFKKFSSQIILNISPWRALYK